MKKTTSGPSGRTLREEATPQLRASPSGCHWPESPMESFYELHRVQRGRLGDPQFKFHDAAGLCRCKSL